jgi:hypothetical protein
LGHRVPVVSVPLSHRGAGRLRGAPLLAGLFVFFPALALYVRTMMPDVGTWDTAEFQTVGIVLGIAHPTGFPTYTLLGWLASVVLQPFGEAALRANLLSAILAASGAGLAGATVSLLTRRAVVGIAAGLALAVSPATWGVAIRADAHALHLALVALVLLLLVVWTERERTGRRADGALLAAALIFAISLGNHALTILLAPGIALLLLTVAPRLPIDRPRLVIACAAALALTTIALYAYLPIRSAMSPPLDYANPETWEGFTYLVFAEQFQGTFQPLPPVLEILAIMGRATLDELGPAAIAAVVGVGLALFRQPRLLLMLGAWFVINWVFAIGYVNADIERYRLAPLLSAVVLAGIGVSGVLDAISYAWRRWATDRWHASRRSRNALMVALALALGVVLVAPSAFFATQRFDDLDHSDWHYARRWLDAVLPQFEPNAAIVSWWGMSTSLWYAQFVEGARPDIFVADDRTRLDLALGDAMEYIETNLDVRPVYLIRLDHDLPPFRERYELTAIDAPYFGPVYRVDGRR